MILYACLIQRPPSCKSLFAITSPSFLFARTRLISRTSVRDQQQNQQQSSQHKNRVQAAQLWSQRQAISMTSVKSLALRNAPTPACSFVVPSLNIPSPIILDDNHPRLGRIDEVGVRSLREHTCGWSARLGDAFRLLVSTTNIDRLEFPVVIPVVFYWRCPWSVVGGWRDRRVLYVAVQGRRLASGAGGGQNEAGAESQQRITYTLRCSRMKMPVLERVFDRKQKTQSERSRAGRTPSARGGLRSSAAAEPAQWGEDSM